MTGGPVASVEHDRAQGIRSNILDVSADTFMVQGYKETTLDDIADRLGATKGLIYYHFRSKFDIFLAVYRQGMQTVHEVVEPLSREPGTPSERLTAMSTAHVQNLMQMLGYHSVIHQGVRERSSTALKERQRQSLRELNILRAEYQMMFRTVIEEGISDGSLRDLDASLMTRTLLSSLNAVDTWYDPSQNPATASESDLSRQIVDIVIGGLASTSGSLRDSVTSDRRQSR